MSEDAAQALAVRIATRLGQVTGVAAVALGGSRARGTATATSDIDLGIYYEPETPLDVDALRALARGLDGRPDAGATAPGEWGPWINGGAWLVVEGVRVDWLYRDLARVRAVIADCRAGHITSDYQVGHPHGFHNHMYLAETIVCRPLHDPTGALAALKAAATPYPEPLRAAIIRRFLWEAGFSLEGGAKGVPRLDVTYVAGCLYRTAACLLQVLFALNREPFLNEKGAAALAAGFPLAPPGLAATLVAVLGATGATEAAMRARLAQMEALLHDVAALVEQHAPGVALPVTRIVPQP